VLVVPVIIPELDVSQCTNTCFKYSYKAVNNTMAMNETTKWENVRICHHLNTTQVFFQSQVNIIYLLVPTIGSELHSGYTNTLNGEVRQQEEPFVYCRVYLHSWNTFHFHGRGLNGPCLGALNEPDGPFLIKKPVENNVRRRDLRA